MKLIPLAVAACLAIGIPCAAQTDTPQPPISPEMLQALRSVHIVSGPRPQTPQQRAEAQAYNSYINDTEHAGNTALHAGNFQAAEDNFRTLIGDGSLDRDYYYELGETLAGEGRTAEAIQQYRQAITMSSSHHTGTLTPMISLADGAALSSHAVSNEVECHGIEEALDWMQYTLLLSQTGQQSEAAMVYNKALSMLADGNLSDLRRLPDPATQSPTAFQSSVHIVLGMYIAIRGWPISNHTLGIQEFDQALRLAPDSPLANYYYGYGWQKLSPAERERLAAKPGQREAVKAALEKAATLGTGEVQAAAKMELSQIK